MNRASSRESQEDDKSNFVTQSKSSDLSRGVQKKELKRVDNHETKKIQNQKAKPKEDEHEK